MASKIGSIIKPRFFLLTVILATTGVLLLYLYAIQLEPTDISIGEINSEMIGQVVSTNGIVKEVRLGQSMIITLIDIEGQSSILIYMPGDVHELLTFKSDIRSGAKLWVKGEVGEYNGNPEILIRSERDVVLLSTSTEIDIEIETLAKNPEHFRDLNVSVEGIVVSVEMFIYNDDSGTRLILRDGDYEMSCIVYGSDMTQKVVPGTKMTFEGTFEYYEGKLGWYLVRQE
jgi:DNA/RNA endonuclease YhcR with UshA esterase domain